MAPTAALKTSAATKKADAAAKLKAAQAGVSSLPQADADDSAAYRTAVEQAAQAISDYVTAAAEDGADLDALDSAPRQAMATRDTERQNLTTAHSGNGALTKFASVDKAQDLWFDAERNLARTRQRSLRLQKFVDLVKANKIAPFTQYAKDNWPDKPAEFYAEAYSLWATDPEYLKNNAKALYDWFHAGLYR